MSTSSGVPSASYQAQRQPQIATLGWALRRAALGILILAATVTLGAWLLYASIEPEETGAGPQAPSETSSPQR